MIKECEKCDHAEMCKWIDTIGEVGRCDFASTNCVKIPDNATNGDVIKALFPQMNTKKLKTATVMRIHNIFSASCDLEWWNAPYKKEDDT